jgi:PPOX class probable F420-dependent enzyme
MSGVGALAGEKYISLTTFKQDGTPVATPVWVVSDDGRRLLVWTGPQTWKVKRLRRDPRVIVSASDFRGRTRGESYEGVGRLLDTSREASLSRCSTGSTA